MEKPNSLSSSKVIEVNVISAEGLFVNSWKKLKAFVVVSSDPFNSSKTGMDTEGENYPLWNEKLVMELPVHARFITVEVHSGSGSKLIGSVNVPVSDFSGGYLPENYLSFLSYRLRDGNGKKNGIINLSFMVKGTRGGTGCVAGCSRPWTGVPVVEGKVSGHGMVTGIPVYNNNQHK